MQFALGVKLHCLLPDLTVDITEGHMQTRYEAIGRRLAGVFPSQDWAKIGYFAFCHRNMGVVVCMVDTACPKRHVTLPLTHAQMSEHSEWAFVENWSRDAYLVSQSADTRPGSRLERAFPTEWENFLRLELESFEPDGVSAPKSFVDIGVRGRNLKKPRGALKSRIAEPVAGAPPPHASAGSGAAPIADAPGPARHPRPAAPLAARLSFRHSAR